MVADAFDLFEKMRRQNHADAIFGTHSMNELKHDVSLHRIEAIGWFIEKYEFGIMSDSCCQFHSLALAGRHRANRAETFFTKPDQPQRIAGSFSTCLLGKAVQLSQMPNKIGSLHIGWQMMMFRRITDPGTNLGARGLGIMTKHGQVPTITWLEPQYQ